MPVCPDGHDSTDPDFCDICGMRIGGAAAPGQGAAGAAAGPAPGAPDAGPAPGAPDAGPAPDAADGAAEPCPQCGTGRSGQFCETCGYDFASGKPMSPAAPAAGRGGPAATGPDSSGAVGAGPGDGGTPGAQRPVWTAVVTADRAYYDRVIAEGGPDAASIEFPGYCPERRFRLSGAEVRIGRRSASRGLEPEIDLTGPPADPGVSHLHAVLLPEPDGSWVILDPGSANGTMVNDGEIPGGVRVPLHDGDRVCIGAWTVLQIRAADGS